MADSLPPYFKADYVETMKNAVMSLQKLGQPQIKEEFDSSECREEGNLFYRQGKYYKAISSFSKALCYAHKGSKDVGLALANRSAVLMSVGFYKESISDAQLAMTSNYPEDTKFKLHQRMSVCHKMMGNNDLAKKQYSECCRLINEKVPSDKRKSALESAEKDFKNGILPKFKKVSVVFSEVPKVSYGCHPDMPGVSSSIGLQENEQYGIHFVATRQIKAGDVLFVEEPLVYNLIEKMDNQSIENKEMETNYTHCFHCLKPCFNMSPCNHCPFAMFCSEACRKLAWSKYHKLECSARNNYAQSRSNDDFTSNSIMVTLCCKMVSTFGIENCIKAMNNPETAPSPLKEILKFPQAVYPVEMLMKTKYLALQIAANCFNASGSKKKRLAEFIVVALMVHKRNAVTMYQAHYDADTDMVVREYRTAWALCKNMAYVPHSCVSNSCAITYGGKTIANIANRTIHQGEVITATYIPNSFEVPVAARREELATSYNFTCKCKACLKNWESKQYLTQQVLDRHPKVGKLYDLLLSPVSNFVCYHQGLAAVTDKKVFKLCVEFQEELLKIGIPTTDLFFVGTQRLITKHLEHSAKKFVLNGAGEPHLFAPDMNMKEELRLLRQQ